jgi:hypothetical protein
MTHTSVRQLKGDSEMKKIMSLMLGLSLVLGAASMFAQDTPAKKDDKTTTTKKPKKGKKKPTTDTTTTPTPPKS